MTRVVGALLAAERLSHRSNGEVAQKALLGARGRLLTLTGAGGCGKTRLGEVDIELHAQEQARRWLVRGLELRHGGGERFGIAQTLARLAALAAAAAQRERALILAGAA